MTTETRLKSLEDRMDEFESAMLSGDPLGAAQRLASKRKAALVDVQNPAKLTNAQIDDIAKDDGTDDAENAANRDVAEGLKDDRTKAKAGEKRSGGSGGARG